MTFDQVHSPELAAAPPLGLSAAYWGKLTPAHKALYAVVRPLPGAAYTADWGLSELERTLATTADSMRDVGGSFDLEPDFQRGHVWTDEQGSRFVESWIRGLDVGRIVFNCPAWSKPTSGDGDLPDYTFQCVDGLQRLTAFRKFVRGDIAVFDGLSAQDLKGSPFDPLKHVYRLRVVIYELDRRADLLNLYLALNAGGTAHAPEELARVSALLAQASGDQHRSIDRPRP